MSTPMATPVMAALPTAWLKNAIRLIMTIEPSTPSSGPISNVHSSALIRNSYWNGSGKAPRSASACNWLRMNSYTGVIGWSLTENASSRVLRRESHGKGLDH